MCLVVPTIGGGVADPEAPGIDPCGGGPLDRKGDALVRGLQRLAA